MITVSFLLIFPDVIGRKMITVTVENQNEVGRLGIFQLPGIDINGSIAFDLHA